MMMLLAVRSDPRTVYQHAIEHFNPRDVAEAFAASRGITVPRQLQTALKDRMRTDGTDIAGEFRALAPDCPPIHIQRWSTRRVATSLLLLGGGLILASLLVDNLNAANFF